MRNDGGEVSHQMPIVTSVMVSKKIWTTFLESVLVQKTFWNFFIPRGKRQVLENLSFDSWITKNLKGDIHSNAQRKWLNFLAIVTWWMWKWRNEAIYHNTEKSVPQKIHRLIQQEKEIGNAYVRTIRLSNAKIEVGMRKCYWTPLAMGGWQ